MVIHYIRLEYHRQLKTHRWLVAHALKQEANTRGPEANNRRM